MRRNIKLTSRRSDCVTKMETCSLYLLFIRNGRMDMKTGIHGAGRTASTPRP
jgi:hypothetical protein